MSYLVANIPPIEVYVDKTFRLVVEIISIDEKKRNLLFKNTCYDDEKILVVGNTRVFLP